MPARARLLEWMQSPGPKAIGLCPEDVDSNAAVMNEVQQRLLFAPEQPDEGWWGTWARMAFNVDASDPYITTPAGVSRLTAITVCRKPVIIRNEWYEFLEFGNGLRPLNCNGSRPICENMAAFQRGQSGGTVVTFSDLRPPKLIRIYPTDAMDVGKKVLLQGKNQFGDLVKSTDGTNVFNGEFLTLVLPFVVNTEILNEITGIQKDLTVGPVQFFELDPETQEQRLILIMEPGEQVASYSRIYINGLCSPCCGTHNIQVEAMAKLSFVPVRVATDTLIIGNLPAILEEAQAARYDGMDTLGAKRMADIHHAAALRFLGGELDAYVGKQRISVAVPLWNSDRLRMQPI